MNIRIPGNEVPLRLIEFLDADCALCQKKAQVAHHRVYPKRGSETIKHITPLCHECHAWVSYKQMCYHELLYAIRLKGEALAVLKDKAFAAAFLDEKFHKLLAEAEYEYEAQIAAASFPNFLRPDVNVVACRKRPEEIAAESQRRRVVLARLLFSPCKLVASNLA